MMKFSTSAKGPQRALSNEHHDPNQGTRRHFNDRHRVTSFALAPNTPQRWHARPNPALFTTSDLGGTSPRTSHKISNVRLLTELSLTNGHIRNIKSYQGSATRPEWPTLIVQLTSTYKRGIEKAWEPPANEPISRSVFKACLHHKDPHNQTRRSS